MHLTLQCNRQSESRHVIAVSAIDHSALLRPLWGLEATYDVHLRLIGKLVTGDFLLVIIELFSLGAFVLSQSTRLTDRQTSIARCDLTKLDAHKNAALLSHANFSPMTLQSRCSCPVSFRLLGMVGYNIATL